MSTSSRMAVAVHLLTLLESRGGKPVPSEDAARSINTNPVVVRRLAALLGGPGLVSSRHGPGGGLALARPAAEITLKDVYQAVEPDPLFALHPAPPNGKCPVGRSIRQVLEGQFERAESAMESALADTTIAEIARLVGKAAERR